MSPSIIGGQCSLVDGGRPKPDNKHAIAAYGAAIADTFSQINGVSKNLPHHSPLPAI